MLISDCNDFFDVDVDVDFDVDQLFLMILIHFSETHDNFLMDAFNVLCICCLTLFSSFLVMLRLLLHKDEMKE